MVEETSDGSDIDEQIVEDVREFIDGDEKKERIIREIVEYEEENAGEKDYWMDKEEVDDIFWALGEDVSMAPAYMGMLKNAYFTNVVLDTNSQTVLCLSDRESVKAALDEEENEPDEWSDEWIAEQVGESSLASNFAEVEVTEDDKQEIYDITEDVDALDYWSQYVAPSLKNRERGKKASLAMLASPEDKHGTKGRINILIYGPPGTGKSALKNFLKEKFGAETIDGPRVSKADITYNKSSDEFGQLPKAHKGILVIEEADEMDEEPLGAALTSLGEAGQIEIRDMEIPAEVRGVVLGNFESQAEIVEQWSPETLNRFDFVLKFDMLDDEMKDDVIDWHYKYFRKPKPDDNQSLLRKYLKLVREFDPEIEEHEKIGEFRRDNIDKVENVREGISIMNVAWTIARLNFENVKLDHYVQAFDIVTTDDSSISDYFE